MKTKFKTVPVVGFKALDDAQGIVSTIVSVTGIEDEVKDVILPGAYAKTLAARTPKGVWSHTWEQPVSKTITAEELLPGDSRLPTKQRNGEDWPKEAGGLLVETQFNLETQRGREAFSDVKFFADEQEWSIGYSVPVGGAKIDPKTGTRYIKDIDLFEYSPVLFGAMPLTTTTGVKSLGEREPVKDAQEAWKAASLDERLEWLEELDGKLHAFKPSDDDDSICATCGEEKDDDETYHLPDDDSKAKAVDAADEPHEYEGDGATCEICGRDKAEHDAWDAENADDAKAKAAKEGTPPDPEATDLPEGGQEGGQGIEPGVADPADPAAGTEPPELPVEGDEPKPEDEKAGVTVTTDESGAMVISVADGADPADVTAAVESFLAEKALSEKVYARTPGAYEERLEAVRCACSNWARDFAPGFAIAANYYWIGAWPEATWEDRVLFMVYTEGATFDSWTYLADYTYDETTGEAVLGEPVEVTVEATIVEKGLKRAMAEAKAGRVLSSGNADKLVNVVSTLIDLLDSAGIEHSFSSGGDAEKGKVEAETEGELVPLGFDLGSTIELIRAAAV